MSKIFVDQVDPRTATTLTLGTTGDTVSIPSGVTIANAGTATGFGASLANGVDNRVVTATSATALNGEANLTFDGTLLNVGADTDAGYNPLQLGSTSDSHAYIQMLGSVSGQIHFGDATSGAAREIGALQYRHDTDSMFLKTNGTTAMAIDSAGIVTKPLQPAFYAHVASNVDPGTAGTYNVPYASEIFDNNADYDNGTYTFTAPVTGRYLFTTTVRGYDVDTSFSLDHRITTSNRVYYGNIGRYYSDQYSSTVVSLADMDASDTAIVSIDSSESSFYISGDTYSYFHGHLVC